MPLLISSVAQPAGQAAEHDHHRQAGRDRCAGFGQESAPSQSGSGPRWWALVVDWAVGRGRLIGAGLGALANRRGELFLFFLAFFLALTGMRLVVCGSRLPSAARSLSGRT